MVLSDQALNDNCISVLNSFSSLYPETYASLYMLYAYGFRWVEVYELSRWFDESRRDYTVVTAKKGNIRKIDKMYVNSYFKTLIASTDDVVYQFRYMSMRRYFKQFSNYSNLAVGNKPLALHSFRHNRARIMKSQGYSDLEIKVYFGEIEQTNMDKYIYSIITI